MNTGKRQTRGGHVGKSRYPPKKNISDKQPMPIEGVYKNVPLTHAMTALIGCVVTIEVKNGKVYEGVLKTFSPNMEIVLSTVHLVEDTGAKGDSLPTQETLIENLIFSVDHVVKMTATNVDLSYAEQRDGFTDSAISRYNGHGSEKDLRELQPWQADADAEDIRLEDSPGWTAEDMFKRNEQTFNVKSVYNDDLEQYTTPLQKTDSPEWLEREKNAERIAAEIEGNEVSQRRYEAENEDGQDEEEKFSAVVRPGKSNIQFGSGTPVQSSASSRYNTSNHRAYQQHHGRQHRIPEPPESSRTNGKTDDKRTSGVSSDSRALKASASDPQTGNSPTGKADGKTLTTEKEKLKEFGEKFKLADPNRPPAKMPLPVDEVEQKLTSASISMSAPAASAASPTGGGNTSASGQSTNATAAVTPAAASSNAPAAAAGVPTVQIPASCSPVANGSLSANNASSESADSGSTKDAAENADKPDKDTPKVTSSLNPNAPVFQPRQPVPSSPTGYNVSSPQPPQHNQSRNAKKATVSYRGNPHNQHHGADQLTPAHVQAATGSPFITNQYTGFYPYNHFQMSYMPARGQDMGQAQHFYGMPQGVMHSHGPYSGGVQQILQTNGMHVQPQPTPPPQPPQSAGGGSGPTAVGGPSTPQQVMQIGGGVATASQQQPAQPLSVAAQGVMAQQPYGGYQTQSATAAGATLGPPPLQPSPQSSAASPLAAPVPYSGGQYYPYPIAYGGMPGQPPHGSVHQMQQPLVFYPVPGQQHHNQPIFSAPMQGVPMMAAAPVSAQGGPPMYMQQALASVPISHHQMQNYQPSQQPPPQPQQQP